MTERIRVERRGACTLIGLDRPDKYNALDPEMAAALDDALHDAAREPCVLIIHSTTPGMFAAGADLLEMRDRDMRTALLGVNTRLFERVERHRWPTLAVVDGAAMGAGCELSMAADLRLCSPRARFGQPELNLGILAGAGANWRLPQLVGVGLARRMLYAGEVLDAEGALGAGLVDEVIDSDGLLDAALRLGDRIAERSWLALELTKLALATNRPATTTFDIVGQAMLAETDDKRTRIQAFLDRRSEKRDTAAAP